MSPRHWIGTFALLAIPFTASADEAVPRQQLTPFEITSLAAAKPAAPVQMTNLIGDPAQPGLYTVRVAIAAHTQVQPHTHRDNRSVTVVSGTWSMGYGKTLDVAALKKLPPGSVYSEPAGQPHFAQTTDEPVVILVTGHGPSDTVFVPK
jgi:quercetin dioxygenase-like cupin family protein